jgi:hypothetical protein
MLHIRRAQQMFDWRSYITVRLALVVAVRTLISGLTRFGLGFPTLKVAEIKAEMMKSGEYMQFPSSTYPYEDSNAMMEFPIQ